jgi:hypothetical protein
MTCDVQGIMRHSHTKILSILIPIRCCVLPRAYAAVGCTGATVPVPLAVETLESATGTVQLEQLYTGTALEALAFTRFARCGRFPRKKRSPWKAH